MGFLDRKGKEMKEKMVVVGAVVVVVAVVLAGWYVMFVHFGKGPAFPFMPTANAAEYMTSVSETSETEPLMALTDNEETAMEIAEQYGITFVSFQNGVATFYTDEDVNQVIERGEKNGYPPVYINLKKELYDSQISETELDPSMIDQYSEMESNK